MVLFPTRKNFNYLRFNNVEKLLEMQIYLHAYRRNSRCHFHCEVLDKTLSTFPFQWFYMELCKISPSNFISNPNYCAWTFHSILLHMNVYVPIIQDNYHILYQPLWINQSNWHANHLSAGQNPIAGSVLCRIMPGMWRYSKLHFSWKQMFLFRL